MASTSRPHGFRPRSLISLSAGLFLASLSAHAAPLVLFTSPDDRSAITTANSEAFTMTGFCSENGRFVTVSGPRSSTTTCVANEWVVTQDLSFVFDATYTYSANHASASGEQAPTATRTFIKDTIPPFNNRIVINGGVVPLVPRVNVALSSIDATEMYLTNTAGCASGGNWQPYATSASWFLAPVNGAATVYAAFRDEVGNVSSCVSSTIPVAFTPVYPVLTFTSPAANSLIPASIAGAVPVSGTCSESGQLVALTGSASTSVTCESGTWSVSLSFVTLPDGLITVQASQTNSLGYTATVSLPLQKDTVAPALVISPFSQGDYANLANASAFPVSGTCSEEGRDVELSGLQIPSAPNVIGTAKCAQGAWSLVADLKDFGQGTVTLVAAQSDLAGNRGYSLARNLIKDTLPPLLQSVAINQGATVTNSLNATVTLVAADAVAALVTTSVGCAVGTYQAYAAQWAITLPGAQGAATVYARVRDVAGNLSPCVSDSIVIDTMAPQVTIAAVPTYINSSNASGVAVTGTCSESGREVSLDGAATAVAVCQAGLWSATLDLSGAAEGMVSLTAHHVDEAGNAALPYTQKYTKDTVAPSGTIAIAGGAVITTQAGVELSLASADAKEMYVTSVAGCSAGGAWEALAAKKAWTLTQLNSVATVYAAFRDVAGNVSACVNDTILHDSLAPDAPVFVRAEPPSGSSTPVFIGQAASLDTKSVSLYLDSACAAAAVGTSSKEVFESAGIPVVLSGGGTIALYARATDQAGLSSACVAFTQYTRELPPLVISPASVQLTSETGGKAAFSATGGMPPYRFSVVGGAGTVAADTGAFEVAPGATGQTLVRVTDQAGKTADATVAHLRAITGLQLDGAVRAIAVDPQGNRYLGGSFGRMGGRAVHGLIALDPAANPIDSIASPSGFDGAVRAIVPLADGGMLVGGEFTRYQDIVVNGLAKLDAQGALDSAFNGNGAGFNGAVQAIAVGAAGDVYVAGAFTTYRGQAAQRLAKLRADGTLDPAFSPALADNGASGTIYALALQEGGLYLGGDFATYRGAAAKNIARVSITDGALDTVFSPATGANGFDGPVYALATGASELYAGGAFKSYRGTAISALAKIVSGGLLATGFNAGLAATSGSPFVRAIALDGGALYVGGSFDSSQKVVSRNLLKLGLDGVMDSAFQTSGGTDGAVMSLALRGTALHAVGSFRKYGLALVNGYAAIQAQSGQIATAARVEESGFSKSASVPSLAAVAVSADGARILIGGDMVGAIYGGTIRRGLLRLTPDGKLDTSFLAPDALDGDVNAIAMTTDGLYIGGGFSKVSGNIANSLAKLSFNGDVDLVLSPQKAQNGFDRPVWAITLFNQALYVGGDFNKYRGGWANGLARLSLSGVQDNSFAAKDATNGRVSSLMIGDAGASLYLGGQFNAIKKQDAHRVGKLGLANSALDLTFSPPDGAFGYTNGTNNDVRSIAIDAATGRIYVGGKFNRYRGGFAYSVTRLFTDGRVDTTFSAVTDGDVNAIVLSGDARRIYLGGSFANVNGQAARLLAVVDVAGALDPVFHAAGNGGFGGGKASIEALLLDGGSLLVGGEFSSYRNQPVLNWSVLDPINGAAK